MCRVTAALTSKRYKELESAPLAGAAGPGVCGRPVYSEPGGQRLVPEPGLHRHRGPPEELRTAGLPEQPGPAEEPPPAAAHRVTTPPTPSALRLPSTSLFCASPTEASVPDPSLSLSHLLDGWKLGPLDVSERFGCRLELTRLCGRGRGRIQGAMLWRPVL